MVAQEPDFADTSIGSSTVCKKVTRQAQAYVQIGSTEVKSKESSVWIKKSRVRRILYRATRVERKRVTGNATKSRKPCYRLISYGTRHIEHLSEPFRTNPPALFLQASASKLSWVPHVPVVFKAKDTHPVSDPLGTPVTNVGLHEGKKLRS